MERHKQLLTKLGPKVAVVSGMTKQFFIAGLCRTRSTWLSNLFSDGEAICYHEAVATVDGLEQYQNKLSDREFKSVGDCGAALLTSWEQINGLFPDAPWLFVHRPADECLTSYNHAFPDRKLTEHQIRFYSDKLELCSDLIGTRGYSVNFDQLDDESVMARIYNHLNLPFNRKRYHLLKTFRVNMIFEKTEPEYNTNIRRAVREAYQPSQIHLDFYAVIHELCAGNAEVEQWLIDLFNLSSTWDHVLDGDKVDVAIMNSCLSNILLKWPTNTFYQNAKVMLAPTIANVIQAWEYSNGRPRHELAYRLYTEVPLAVAYLLGGQAKQQQFSTQLYAIAEALKQRNDKVGQQ